MLALGVASTESCPFINMRDAAAFFLFSLLTYRFFVDQVLFIVHRPQKAIKTHTLQITLISNPSKSAELTLVTDPVYSTRRSFKCLTDDPTTKLYASVNISIIITAPQWPIPNQPRVCSRKLRQSWSWLCSNTWKICRKWVQLPSSYIPPTHYQRHKD